MNTNTTNTNASGTGSTGGGRPSFSEQISALGARISRVISRDGGAAAGAGRPSTETSTSTYVGDANAVAGYGAFGKLGLDSTCESRSLIPFCFFGAMFFSGILSSESRYVFLRFLVLSI